MVNSRSKGARGEREWAEWLRDHLGCNAARRGVQYSGGPESPDVAHGIPGTHVEVKRVEALRLREAVAQAERDAGRSIPYVAHRWNRGEWLVIVPAARLAELAEAVCRMEQD